MTATDPTTTMPAPARLAHFPISFFGASMGVFGLALALRAAGLAGASMAIAGAGAIMFLVLLAFYGLKAVRHPAHVAQEWHHPVRLAFFPAANISILLFALLVQHTVPTFAHALWIAGAAIQAVLTVIVISAWISHRPFNHITLSPAWFIPAVANVIVPLGGTHFGYTEISWYFFSVGLLFWLILMTLVFNRLIFHDPLPKKLRPTLVILIAPPSVAFLAWIELNGGNIDAVARLLLNSGLFFAALVIIQVPALLRLPFALSFWALSFPLAALTTACFRFGALHGADAYRALGFILLALLVITILALSLRTVRAIRAGQICQPE